LGTRCRWLILLGKCIQDSVGNTVERQNIVEASASNLITAGIEVDFDGSGPLISDGNTATQWGANMLRGMIRPTGNPGSGGLFPLSLTELYTYFGGTPSSPNHGIHLANEGVSRIAVRADATETAGHWWLRSPGGGNLVRFVLTDGSITSNSNTNSALGWRGAIWIRR